MAPTDRIRTQFWHSPQRWNGSREGARLLGVQEVPGSNPGSPTTIPHRLTARTINFQYVLESTSRTPGRRKSPTNRHSPSSYISSATSIKPLHSADRGGDAGGNAEHVSFFGADDRTTLSRIMSGMTRSSPRSRRPTQHCPPA
jgi:hypothetical protein